MADPSLQQVLAHVHGLALRGGDGAPADADLLNRYLGHRDEAAFAALVHRHGPMVLGTCRRLLSCEHDAEDAWQATFLVLACQGKAIRKRQSLAAWLHGVACRLACKIRSRLARDRRRGQELTDRPTQPDSADPSWREVLAILDEELERLPAHYRNPLILCHLEGLTRDEAARRLSCSVDVLRGRLERGRERLRGRLVRRGVALSTTMLAAGLSAPVGAAEVPANLVVEVVRVGGKVLEGSPYKSVVSGRIANLMEGVLHVMTGTRLKLAAALILVASLGGISAGLLARADDTRGTEAPTGGGAAQTRKGGVPDLAQRVAELEKQVAKLNEEVKVLRAASGNTPTKEDKSVVTERIALKNVPAGDVAKVLQDLLGKRANFSLVTDEATNSLIVRGTQADIAVARQMMLKLAPDDTRRGTGTGTGVVRWSETSDERPVLKAFTLNVAKSETAVKVIEQLMKDVGLKVAAAGERTILFHGSPQKIKEVEQLIKMLDTISEVERDAMLKRIGPSTGGGPR